ncbi:MAG: DUF2461 domain-containing protein [Chloroflexota bacterium]
MSLQVTLDFLAQLRENNNKEWFDEHRADYDIARGAFSDMLGELMMRFSDVDELPVLAAKEVMFRINRDVRFSKDKSPYKSSMSALFGTDGRKSTSRYYYVSIEPDGQSIVASGLKSPDTKTLKMIREVIAEDAQPLRDIIQADAFVSMFGELQGDQLKTAPRGYDANHPDIDLLRYKEFMASRHFSDDDVARDDFVDDILETCRALKPLTLYFHTIIKRERA